MKINTFVKTIYGVLASLFFLLIPLNNVLAIESERITLFKSDISQSKDTTISITEEIHYFFPTSKRGIYWEIPVNYKVAGAFQRPTLFHLEKMYYYSQDNPSTTYSNYEKEITNGYVRLKIGDPETYISGNYVYVIQYTLKNATNYFDDYDELYLNLIGPGWNVPIDSAYATIKTAGKVTDYNCFTGGVDSKESNCEVTKVNDTEVNIEITKPLQSYEGYTTTIVMPKGTLDDTTDQQRIAFIIANIGILLPIPVLIFIIFIIKKKGKNEKLTIIPHYEAPENLNPLLAGYLYSKNLSNKYITAEILSLAIQGYIKINQVKKNRYELIKTSKDRSPLEESQNFLLEGLFRKEDVVDTKSMDSQFYMTVSKISSNISTQLFTEDLYSKQRKSLSTSLLLLGIAFCGIALVSIGIAIELALIGWVFGLLVSGIIVLISLAIIDPRSDKGNQMYHELLGLKMYINTAEKHRIEFHNDPKKFQGIFEQLLPYAMIFGLEKKWAKEFEDIYTQQPEWYSGDMTNFNAYLLANSLGTISKNVQAYSTPPRTSSSGFSSSHGASGGSGFSGGSSGGGFGGSGGGSW